MAIVRKPPVKPQVVAAALQKQPEDIKTAPAATLPEAGEILRTSADDVRTQVQETQETFRKAAEQGIEKTRDAYARMKADAEAATSSIETSFAAARSGIDTINTKAIDAIKAQTQAGFEHAKALLAAKDIKDVFTLQSEFAKKQFETFAAQSKEFSGHFQAIATQSIEPLKAAMSRSTQA